MKLPAIAGALLAGTAALAVALPGAASAAAAPSHPSAPAPAEAGATAIHSQSDNFTKGTALVFRNQTSDTVWVREHHIFDRWYNYEAVKPGASKGYTGNYGSVDDVQLRIFRSEEDAKENSVFKAIEVDAENPAWSSPWLSVSYVSHYYSVGTEQYYVSPIAKAHFIGKRHADSSHYKEFELRMTKGWQ